MDFLSLPPPLAITLIIGEHFIQTVYLDIEHLLDFQGKSKRLCAPVDHILEEKIK